MFFRLAAALFLFAMPAFAQLPSIEPGVSHELAKWRATHYSDVRYKLNLTLEKMSPVLKGTIEIRVKVGAGTLLSPSPRGGEIPPIVLDWRKLPGHEKDSTVSSVTLNGRSAAVISPQAAMGTGVSPLPFEERDEHLIFRDGVKAGENVIKLDFTSPILTSGSAITRYIDKEDGAEYIYSLFVPSDASTAFPVFDQPDLKARFSFLLNVPNQWKATSNALIKSLTKTECRAGSFCGLGYTFEETLPISTYVFAFAAGEFGQMASYELPVSARAGSPDILTQVFFRKSQAAKFKPHAAEVFRLNREGIKFLETYFDYKFPFPKYDLVLIPEFPFGGMEHAGATFLRESAIIFPTEPTKGDHISRANLIFHEAAHQWFGDTVTMRWFDDLWLKEGFAEFMAYKTLEKVMPEANAWKVFYERNKQAAYLTDSTKGTTPIYQPIANLNSAKSAYGNIVYRKAPSFLRQAEFYLGEQKFQTAVRAFLKKHEFANAGWEDLVDDFETASGKNLSDFAQGWVTRPGAPEIRTRRLTRKYQNRELDNHFVYQEIRTKDNGTFWTQKVDFLTIEPSGEKRTQTVVFERDHRNTWQLPIGLSRYPTDVEWFSPAAVIPNYGDYGYGIFLLDDKSRDYVLKHIGEEKDPFLRSMMWGSLWDSVREAELDPREYVELAISRLTTTPARKPATPLKQGGEQDETIIASILGRVGTAMNYYLDAATRDCLVPRLEDVLLDRLQQASTAGERVTFYRTFVNNASTPKGREVLREMLQQGKGSEKMQALRTKDKVDIITRLAILGDVDVPKLLADLEKTETSDDAKRYAYAARAGFATPENKAKFWNDFVNNKNISESWIEAAVGPFNSVKHADLTQPYLQRALTELPNLKRTRKIFFINNWLAAWIGGQRDQAALAIVNKFLADNPKLDNDLRLKILENIDLIERAVKIRKRWNH